MANLMSLEGLFSDTDMLTDDEELLMLNLVLKKSWEEVSVW